MYQADSWDQDTETLDVWREAHEKPLRDGTDQASGKLYEKAVGATQPT